LLLGGVGCGGEGRQLLRSGESERRRRRLPVRLRARHQGAMMARYLALGVVAGCAAWLGACAAEPAADPKAPAADQGRASSRGAPPESHGSSRGEAIEATIAAGRDGFRACFDTWSRTHPGEPGKVP